jgi:prophage antirepressor-like protein
MNPLEKLSTPIEIYNFKSQQLRVVGTFEDPWFAAKDICDILGISNVTQSLTNIPDKWKGLCKTYTLSGDQVMNIVNESGLYKMILRSNKPEAQPFQEWVCEDVLPGIRKKGEYVLEEYKKKLEDRQKALDEKTQEAQEKQKILEEQQIALEKKDEHIRKLQREKQVVEGRNCVYLCTTDEKESEGIYTIGQTTDIERRLKDYNDNKLFNFKMIKYISCKSAKLMDAIETILLAKFNKYKIISNRDVFQLPEGKDVSFFIQWYDYISKFCEDIEEGVELEERTEEEKQKLLIELQEERNKEKIIYNKKYHEENKEKAFEKNKEYREKNKEVIAKIKQNYVEENKEIMFEMRKKYREEKKENIAEKKKIYAEENKEELSQYNKQYYEENKEIILQYHKQYHEENKEIIAEKKKIYVEENKEIIAEKKKIYVEENKEEISQYLKQYYEENKEIVSEYSKQRYQENKEKIKEKSLKRYKENKEKIKEKMIKRYNENKDVLIECECGRSIKKLRISYHKKTKIHITTLQLKLEKSDQKIDRSSQIILENFNESSSPETSNIPKKETSDKIVKVVEKISCECGKSISKSSIKQHMASKMHEIALKLKNK